MKKTIQVLRYSFYGALMSGTFFSCQTEDLLNYESVDNLLFQEPLFARGTDLGTQLLDYVECESVCIEPDSNTYYKMSDVATSTSGGGANINTKEVSYEAYNSEDSFVVSVNYDIISGKSNAHAEITISINGNTVVFENVEKSNTVSHSIALPVDWIACDEISFQITQKGLGNPIIFEEIYQLVGVCDNCEESFSYAENEDSSYTFTYISEESLRNAEVKFTSPHIVDFEALDGKIYSVNPGNLKGSPTVLTWTGDIEACTEITFTISFVPDCDQNNAGFANVFTDFKVNDISKKGENSNIRISCDLE
ncbi:hypothetical protein FJ651_15190 [Paucihalobacter ruber]|uniref:Uncharacterized protein n=1 Tax=Paucihalobacter ruber TaxID=2567861 RepID=A0A506PEQ8_9FLAO|nr:hypothetical protein [Paucihalobacter ruber]TPV31532.1 hypothetical protein FJ651_15190 [Paucihalobacter ruber]